MGDQVSEGGFTIPRLPASAGAMLFDGLGRLLIVKPTYKRRWSIPGGMMEADGETPWEACRREVREETSLELNAGRLACVDFLRPRPGKPGGLRFLFDAGELGPDQEEGIVLDPVELSEHRFVELAEALSLLSGPLRRRVGRAARGRRPWYLEDGRPVPEVRT